MPYLILYNMIVVYWIHVQLQSLKELHFLCMIFYCRFEGSLQIVNIQLVDFYNSRYHKNNSMYL